MKGTVLIWPLTSALRFSIRSAPESFSESREGRHTSGGSMPAPFTYEDISNHTSNGVVVTDAYGITVKINQPAEKMLDLPSLGSTGVSVRELMPELGEMVSRCLDSGNPIPGQHINAANCGFMANATPIREKGQVQGVICIFQELDQFETAAHGLESYKRISRQWETVFKASSDGIWVCNGDGVVIDVNAASEALNGIKAGDVIGKPMSGLIKEGLFDRSVTLEVLDTRRQVSVMQFIRRTGRYLLATGTPVIDEDGSILLVVVNERDMTQLNAMREELARTQQMTEKIRDELAGLSLRELREQQIVAESDNMRQILQVALKLARLDTANVLVTGESGTGKGLLAKFIHQSSARRREPFIQINCAALPENLLEAELFGYEKGAFTGASEKGKVGLFELADGGTLFLDEIGDMPKTGVEPPVKWPVGSA
jgi:PAS domain S-box-containing protein